MFPGASTTEQRREGTALLLLKQEASFRSTPEVLEGFSNDL